MDSDGNPVHTMDLQNFIKGQELQVSKNVHDRAGFAFLKEHNPSSAAEILDIHAQIDNLIDVSTHSTSHNRLCRRPATR